MNDLIDEVRIEGQILIGDKNIYEPGTNLIQLRKEVACLPAAQPFPSPFWKCYLRLKIHGQLPRGKRMGRNRLSGLIRRGSLGKPQG